MNMAKIRSIGANSVTEAPLDEVHDDLDKRNNFQGQVEQIVKQLEALAPGLRQKMRKEKEAQRTDEQRKALSFLRLARRSPIGE